jgi:uncharacterized protein YegP (UPF0339 family)
MKFEIEKLKDNTFTVRIKVNGKVTFSNNGINTKQAAYKKLAGLYNGLLTSLDMQLKHVTKTRGFNSLDIVTEEGQNVIYVKEINC